MSTNLVLVPCSMLEAGSIRTSDCRLAQGGLLCPPERAEAIRRRLAVRAQVRRDDWAYAKDITCRRYYRD